MYCHKGYNGRWFPHGLLLLLRLTRLVQEHQDDVQYQRHGGGAHTARSSQGARPSGAGAGSPFSAPAARVSSSQTAAPDCHAGAAYASTSPLLDFMPWRAQASSSHVRDGHRAAAGNAAGSARAGGGSSRASRQAPQPAGLGKGVKIEGGGSGLDGVEAGSGLTPSRAMAKSDSTLSLGALVGEDEMDLGQMVAYRAPSVGLSPQQMSVADFGVGGGADAALDEGAVDLGPNAMMTAMGGCAESAHDGMRGQLGLVDGMLTRGAHDFEHDTGSGFIFDLWRSSPSMSSSDPSAGAAAAGPSRALPSSSSSGPR